MKKFLSVLLLVVLVIGLLVPALGFAKEKYMWIKTGNGKPVNVRTGPGKNNEVMGQIAYGKQVIVHQKANGWALVEPVDWSLSNPGYVSTSFLVNSDPGKYKPTPTKEPVTTVEAALKKIKYLKEPVSAKIITKRPTNYVHLRWYPDTNASYIEKYLCDTEVEVLAESKTWSQVRMVEDGYVGFILTANLDKEIAE